MGIIAPQSRKRNINEHVDEFPDGAEDGPLDGHYISNYMWIFKIKEGKKGYVEPRKDKPTNNESE